MRLSAFDLNEPVPELNRPHALAIIRPWTDISSVGSLVLSCLESSLGAKDLGKLARPGTFSTLHGTAPHLSGKKTTIARLMFLIPSITYGTQSGSHDFLFLRLLEPHMQAEEYIDSVVELLKTFGVKRYCLIGAMYDMVPSPRPILVTGSASNPELQNRLALDNIRHSDYQGLPQFYLS